ncbi:hypothetical protein EN893_06965, partial [Mesorhizobium sp. M7A.F.Ca.CA.004.04.2.1]
MGWPDAAPFDAILVAAAAPAPPPALREQLDIGGRLLIPSAKTLQPASRQDRTKGSRDLQGGGFRRRPVPPAHRRTMRGPKRTD